MCHFLGCNTFASKQASIALRISIIPFEDSLVLRARILKPHLRPEECVNPGDMENGSFTLGAFLQEDANPEVLVGIASFEPEALPAISPVAAFRLRGMGTEVQYRRLKIGSALILAGEKILRDQQIRMLWFNARSVAFGFYESLGYQYFGEMFDIPQIGPHKVMYKYL